MQVEQLRKTVKKYTALENIYRVVILQVDGVLSPNDSETNLQLNKSLRKKPRKLKKTKTDGSEGEK